MSETKAFHIGALLTVTSDRILVDQLSRIRLLVDHVTGVEHAGHQVADAAPAVRRHILEQHPWLAEVPVPSSVNSEETARAFLDMVSARHGERHEVERMPFGAYVGREPLAELEEMVGKDRVIPVEIPPAGRR